MDGTRALVRRISEEVDGAVGYMGLWDDDICKAASIEDWYVLTHTSGNRFRGGALWPC